MRTISWLVGSGVGVADHLLHQLICYVVFMEVGAIGTPNVSCSSTEGNPPVAADLVPLKSVAVSACVGTKGRTEERSLLVGGITELDMVAAMSIGVARNAPTLGGTIKTLSVKQGVVTAKPENENSIPFSQESWPASSE